MSDAIEAALGKFAREEGVLVYRTTSHCNLPQAADDAIRFKPSDEAAFFNFNGAVVPIENNDTAEILAVRLKETWRK